MKLMKKLKQKKQKKSALNYNIKEAEKLFKDCDEKIAKEQNLKEGDLFYGYMTGFEFSQFVQSLLISEYGYVLDTGNYENVNYVCAYKLLENIKKHPKIWRKFFMVA